MPKFGWIAFKSGYCATLLVFYGTIGIPAEQYSINQIFQKWLKNYLLDYTNIDWLIDWYTTNIRLSFKMWKIQKSYIKSIQQLCVKHGRNALDPAPRAGQVRRGHDV